MGLDAVFQAGSIAVIGASREPRKVGHDIFKNLLMSKKKVFPVNPKAEKILGKKVFSSVLEIKERVDLAVIAVPAGIVQQVLTECAKKGVKDVIVISAGFSEIGNERMEQKIVEIAKRAGMRLLGPNCLGVIDPHQKLNATFFNKLPIKGRIGIVSQSGALGVAVLDWSIKKGIGLSKFISIGNAADLQMDEAIDYLNKDKNTKVICLYLESLKDGRAFMDAARRSRKPLIALKAGTTGAGAKAAMSHTAALATENAVYDGAFKQVGVSRVNTIYQLFEVAQVHTTKNCPKHHRALVVTNAGGPGVIASDAFERNEVELPRLPPSLVKRLDKRLPKFWSRNNPIDIVGDATPDRYAFVLKEIEKERFFDFVFLILTPQTMSGPEKVAQLLVDFHRRTHIPCFASFMGGRSVDAAKALLENSNILNFDEPEYAAQVIGKIGKCV
jgi:acetyltransferase